MIHHAVVAPIQEAVPPAAAAEAEGQARPQAAPGGHEQHKLHDHGPWNPLAPAANTTGLPLGAAAGKQSVHNTGDHTQGAHGGHHTAAEAAIGGTGVRCCRRAAVLQIHARAHSIGCCGAHVPNVPSSPVLPSLSIFRLDLK